MDQSIHDLRRSILRFLDSRVLLKPEEQRTPLDNLLLETGRAFTDALVRCERNNEATTGAEPAMTRLLRSYNAINAEHARRNVDAEALGTLRDQPFGRDE